MTHPSAPPSGLIAEFSAANALIQAVQRARREGYSRLEAYSPFSIDGMGEALGLPATRVRPIMLAAFVIGAATGLLLQVWTAASAYPIDSGGRPLASWGAFIPVTFEIGVLFAAIAGFATFLVGAGLPRLHHPIFDAPGFDRASDMAFFLEIAGTDPHFDADRTRAFLGTLGALAIADVER